MTNEVNQPLVNLYFNEEMPIIISTCCNCHVELFRSMTYQNMAFHKNFCMPCIADIEMDAWKYRELCK